MRIVIAFLCTLALAAQGPFDGKSGPLVKAGYELLSKGQFNEAAAKFQEGMKADPASSFPISGLSKLFFEASKSTDQVHQTEYRQRALNLAHQALDKDDLDFIANEVLLNADGSAVGSIHQPKPEALTAFNEAEAAYQEHKWDKAAAAYQKALELDPGYTDARLYLGDVFFDQKQYDKAEPLFRKATEMEPRYARAWRFLGDCLKDLGRPNDALAADFKAIEAQPEDYTAWGRLRVDYEGQGKPALIRFHWPAAPAGSIKRDASGKAQVLIPPDLIKGKSPEEMALFGYAIGYPTVQIASENPDYKDKARSELERQARAWTIAMECYEGALKEQKETPRDATWAQLLAFHKAGELQTAVMILCFREAYRQDFEAWKAAHTDGVRAFIEQWHLRP